MKCYIDLVKKDDKLIQAITLYDNVGKIAYKDAVYVTDLSENKFDKDLDMLTWGAKKLKNIGQNRVISEDTPILVFIKSKTLHKWLEQEKAPKLYIEKFSAMMLELSLVMNELDIIQSDNSRAIASVDEPTIKVKDLFAGR